MSVPEFPSIGPPRVVLCSSDAFGEPALRRLHGAGWLAGLVTQPDRERGRGRRVEALPIKSLAESLGIPVLTPEKIGDPESIAALKALAPWYLVIAAYAQYLPKAVREIPPVCLNIHPSLLPKYRGSAPVQAALWYGDTESGVAIHYTEKGIDTGDLLAIEPYPTAEEATGGSLRRQLGELGAHLLIPVIAQLQAGLVAGSAQNHDQATLTRLLTAADRELPLELPAATLVNRIRALAPDPGSTLPWGDQSLRVLKARALPSPESGAEIGDVVRLSKSRVAISCRDSLLELLEVQPAGRNVMPVASFLNGLRELPARVESRPGDPRPLAVPIADAQLLKAVETGEVHG